MITGENAANKELILFVERVERVTADIKELQDDRGDIFREAKSQGYDTATMREIIKLRKLTPQLRAERRSLLDTYMAAFGIGDEE